jgi:hypothetical protein
LFAESYPSLSIRKWEKKSRGYKQMTDEDERFGKQDFITYEMINEPRRSYLSDAAMAER